MYTYTQEDDGSILILDQTTNSNIQWLHRERDIETFSCLLLFGGIQFACRHFINEIE